MWSGAPWAGGAASSSRSCRASCSSSCSRYTTRPRPLISGCARRCRSASPPSSRSSGCVQKSPPSAAIGGLVAAAAAAALALFTGRGAGQLPPGLHHQRRVRRRRCLISALIGWSLIGLAVGFLMGEGTALAAGSAQAARVLLARDRVGGAVLRSAGRAAAAVPRGRRHRRSARSKLDHGLPLFAPLLAVTWLVVRALYPARAERDDAVDGVIDLS